MMAIITFVASALHHNRLGSLLLPPYKLTNHQQDRIYCILPHQQHPLPLDHRDTATHSIGLDLQLVSVELSMSLEVLLLSVSFVSVIHHYLGKFLRAVSAHHQGIVLNPLALLRVAYSNHLRSIIHQVVIPFRILEHLLARY